jgi:hypothetical protein
LLELQDRIPNFWAAAYRIWRKKEQTSKTGKQKVLLKVRILAGCKGSLGNKWLEASVLPFFMYWPGFGSL